MQLKKWQGRLINKEELHVSKVNHFKVFPDRENQPSQVDFFKLQTVEHFIIIYLDNSKQR